MQKWQQICAKINNENFANEAEFEKILDTIFSFAFGWNVDRQESMRVGNNNRIRPDILLKDANGKVCIVVEVKDRSVAVSAKEYEQLASYLKLNQTKFGLLIGKNISVMYNPLSAEPIKLIDIPFKPESEDGKRLADAINNEGNSFKNSNLEALCKEFRGKLKIKEEAKQIVKLLTSEDGATIIAESIKAHPNLQKYNSLSVDEALKSIAIQPRPQATVAPVAKTIAPSTKEHSSVELPAGGRIDLLDPNANISFLGVSRLFIDGKEVPLAKCSWRCVAEAVLVAAYERDHDVFAQCSYVYKNGQPLPRKPINPKDVPGAKDYYYETNFSSAELHRHLILPAARAAGFGRVEVEVYEK